MIENTQPGMLSDWFGGPAGNIVHAAHEAIVMIDGAQCIVALNPAAQRMFGCTSGQVLGDSLARFIPARDREAHAQHVHQFAASGLTEHPMNAFRRTLGLRANGEEFPVQIMLSRVDLADERGTHTYFAALLRDLTVEGKLRDEVERFRARMQSVFELAPVAIWVVERDIVVFANHAAQRLFGLGPHERLVGRRVYDLLHGASHAAVSRQVEHALAGQSDVALVHGRVVRPDGALREVEIAVAALPDHGNTTVQMVVADVTERRRKDAELEQSRQALRRLSASVVQAREDERRRIARELHDDLGQRLTALKMDVASLLDASGAGVREARIGGMLAMLDDTLASVRRIASDLRPMMLDDLGVNAAIEWLARDSQRRMGIDVDVHLCDVEAGLDERVCTTLFRTVQEALTNVARHSQATSVSIGLREDAGDVVLSVEDNGVGIRERSLQRADSFGLLGIRERVAMLGGRMDIDNAPGGGARLTVRLPAARPAHGDTAPESGVST